MILSQSFAKLYYIYFFLYTTLFMHTDSGGTKFSKNRYTMANITPTNGTPKDVNNQLRGAAGLNPDDPNDMAFKLVTILYFFVSQKLTFFLEQHTRTSPHSSLTLVSFPIAPLPRRRWHHWHSCRGGRAVAVLCHGIFRVLLGWQRRGERAVAGVPWRFGAAALQHHWRREGRAAVVGEGGTWGYYALCAVWVSWAVLA